MKKVRVTPYAGVWIEIRLATLYRCQNRVTPYAGVWIEIEQYILTKFKNIVTPYAGVWIEIYVSLYPVSLLQ